MTFKWRFAEAEQSVQRGGSHFRFVSFSPCAIFAFVLRLALQQLSLFHFAFRFAMTLSRQQLIVTCENCSCTHICIPLWYL